MAKLILNSLSGKFLFNKFIDQTLFIKTGEEKENEIIKNNISE